MPYVLAGVMGAVIGSFLNVVAHRLPRGESLVRPGSRCPGCDTPIRAYDNLPVLGWILLRGRCRACGEGISLRYPLVEALTALLWLAVLLTFGLSTDAVFGLVLVTLLVPLSLIDLDHRILPNRIVVPGMALALGLAVALDPGSLVERLVAGGAAGGFLLIAALAYPQGMGMGDVKLAAMLGLFLGRSVGPAMLVGLVAGSLVGAAIIARKGAAEGRKTAIPFGPFLAVGGLVGLFAGPEIVDWYVDNFV